MPGERRVVYFLGAGASFGAGAFAATQGGGRVPIPTQNTFWDTFLRFCASRDNKQLIEAFLYRYFLDYARVPARAGDAARRRQLSPIDVEEVFTFLSERNNAPSVSPQLKSYASRVWSALLEEVGHVFGRFHANRQTRHQYRLLRNQHVRTRDTIVSFNYDVIFEQSLPRHHRWYYEGIHDEHAPQSLRILKPHGSINWVETDGTIEATIPSHDLPEHPVIVAPTHLKFIGMGERLAGDTRAVSGYLNQSRQISHVWNAMEREMGEAKAWVFIGYSFPQSDLYFSSVLRSTLAIRDSNPYIIIVNPDSMAISARLSNRFTIPLDRIRTFPDLQTFNQINRTQMLSHFE
jgi:hypothetical protein